MLESHVIEFLNGNIDIDTFQLLCKNIYYKHISNDDLQYSLDAIKYLPFIHQFSFPEPGTSIDEYKKEVQYYLKLLHHEVEYHYSCIILLPRSEKDCDIDINEALFMKKIIDRFQEKTKSRKQISNLIYNMLRELISQYSNEQEGCFASLNCSNKLSKEYLKERILQLYMYYTGTKEFILQLFCNKTGEDVFFIV